jgi:hypothetical protein
MKKEKHLRIRITELQMKQLIQAILTIGKISKSEFIRQAIMDKIYKVQSQKRSR